MNILQDNNGDMWFMTDKGLTRFSPNSQRMHTFLEKDGLQANAFTTAGFYDANNNLVWTGGVNGFNYFNPDKLNMRDNSPPVRLTNFELFYKPVELASTWSESPLSKTIDQTNKLQLAHDQNVFSFSFTAFEFLAPNETQYAFMLDGYDTAWHSVSSGRRYANYTNIDPGKYTFKVKSANSLGEWSEQEATIEIRIREPWWQTTQAYVIYVVSLFFLFYLLIKIRTQLLVKRASELEATVNLRTQELHKEKSKVEQLLSRKNEEFANVSHEFRTPLTLILGPLAQVLKSNRNEEENRRLNIVQRNGYRLLRMVDQLLNMETFRIKSIAQKSPQTIGKSITLLTESFADLAKEKNIELTLEQPININFEFTPDAFEKVLLNLLSNAIKYTPRNGRIVVTAKRNNGNELEVTVVDTGIGIPESSIDSIFERYHRVHDENSEQVTGAGIGLALVKELVEAHQGRIHVESTLGKGTRISLLLPIIGEVDDQPAGESRSDEIIAMEIMSINAQTQSSTRDEFETPSVLDDNQSSLLIIEDNDDMRHYIAESIKDEYQVFIAKDGAEGVEVAVAEVPDLIISDVMMPIMDGYEATEALRNHDVTNHIPIVLLTARGDRDSRLKGWYQQADEYITKPFDVEELKVRLRNLLEIRNILKKRFSETTFKDSSDTQAVDAKDLDSFKSDQQKQFVKRLNGVLDKLYSEPSLSVADIAMAISMSERQLFRKIKSTLDITPAEYLRRHRMEKAKVLLAEGRSASYAAVEVGFSSQSYFGKCFKAQYGVSPSEFKKSIGF